MILQHLGLAPVPSGAGSGWAAGDRRRHRCRRRCGSCAAGLQIRPPVVHELDRVRQRREVAQLEIVFARNVVGGADGRKHLRLLHGVDAEIRFQIQVEIEHVRRIAGLLGDDLQHLGLNRFLLRGLGLGSGGGRRGHRCRGRCGGSGRLQIRPAVVDELDRVRQRREIAQLEIVVARNVVGRADGRKHLRLFDGVDAEIRFQIQIEIEHIRRIAGLLGDDLHHVDLHRILLPGRVALRLRAPARAFAAPVWTLPEPPARGRPGREGSGFRHRGDRRGRLLDSRGRAPGPWPGACAGRPRVRVRHTR